MAARTAVELDVVGDSSIGRSGIVNVNPVESDSESETGDGEEYVREIAGAGSAGPGHRLAGAFSPPTAAELAASQQAADDRERRGRGGSVGKMFLPKEQAPSDEGAPAGHALKRVRTMRSLKAPKLFQIAQKAAKDKDATRELIRLYEWRKQRRVLLRAAFIYYVFLGIFIAQVFMARNIVQTYHMYNAVKDALIDEEFKFNDSQIHDSFMTMTCVREFWAWARGPLAGAVSGEPDFTIYKYNSILGDVRFRQLRVRDESCKVSSHYQDITTHCWADYSNKNLDEDAFGDHKQFRFMSEDSTRERGVWSSSPSGPWVVYPGCGHVQYLPSPYPGAPGPDYPDEVLKVVNYLSEKNWVDDQTRVVFVDVNLFNGNYNLFANAKMIVEFLAAGDVLPRFVFTPFKLDLYVTASDKFRCFLEIVLVAFLVYFSAMFVLEGIRNLRKRNRVTGDAWWKWYIGFWTWIDFLNIVLFWVATIMILDYATADHKFDWTQATYINLYPIAYSYAQIFNVMGFNILISCIKSFKYFRLIPRMLLLWDTLRLAGPDLSAFLLFFFIIFVGFLGMGFVLFGPQYFGFRDVFASFATCLNMFLGNMDFPGLKRINRILGPLYFYLFLLLVFFTLANMFFAIIVEKFGDAQARTEHTDPLTAELWAALKKIPKRIYRASLRILGRKVAKTDEELVSELQFLSRTTRLGSADGTLSTADVARVLGSTATEESVKRTLGAYRTMRRKAGLSVAEIEDVTKQPDPEEEKGEDEERLEGAGIEEEEELELISPADRKAMKGLVRTQSKMGVKADTLLRSISTISGSDGASRGSIASPTSTWGSRSSAQPLLSRGSVSGMPERKTG